MRRLLILFVIGLTIREALADCSDSSIAHPNPIYVDVQLSGKIVGPPFATADNQAAQEIVAKELVKRLTGKRLRRDLRLPWNFQVASGNQLPRIVVAIHDWDISAQLHYQDDQGHTELIRFPRRELVSEAEIDAGTDPHPNERLGFVADNFIQTYLEPTSSVDALDPFAMQPVLCETLPVTEGILTPDPARISEALPGFRFSLILLSWECYSEFEAESFVWRCRRKPAFGIGYSVSKSRAKRFAFSYSLDGTLKQCLVVEHDVFPDTDVVENRAKVYLSKEQFQSEDDDGDVADTDGFLYST